MDFAPNNYYTPIVKHQPAVSGSKLMLSEDQYVVTKHFEESMVRFTQL